MSDGHCNRNTCGAAGALGARCETVADCAAGLVCAPHGEEARCETPTAENERCYSDAECMSQLCEQTPTQQLPYTYRYYQGFCIGATAPTIPGLHHACEPLAQADEPCTTDTDCVAGLLCRNRVEVVRFLDDEYRRIDVGVCAAP